MRISLQYVDLQPMIRMQATDMQRCRRRSGLPSTVNVSAKEESTQLGETAPQILHGTISSHNFCRHQFLFLGSPQNTPHELQGAGSVLWRSLFPLPCAGLICHAMTTTSPGKIDFSGGYCIREILDAFNQNETLDIHRLLWHIVLPHRTTGK